MIPSQVLKITSESHYDIDRVMPKGWNLVSAKIGGAVVMLGFNSPTKRFYPFDMVIEMGMVEFELRLENAVLKEAA